MIFENKSKSAKAVAKFLGFAFVFYLSWFIIHDYYLVSKTNLVKQFTFLETEISGFILNRIPTKDSFCAFENGILQNGERILKVGDECSGLVLFAIFTGFILAYPGDIKSKSWFIPIGIIVLFVCNILRIVVLTLNKAYFNSVFAFNHHVTFTYLMYVFIFVLWYIWMKKLRKSIFIQKG